jgi:hypothetical protein
MEIDEKESMAIVKVIIFNSLKNKNFIKINKRKIKNLVRTNRKEQDKIDFD